MATRQEIYEQCMKNLEELLHDENYHYQLGLLRAWLCRIASEDHQVRREIEARLDRKLNAQNQKGNGSAQRGPRARS